MFCIKCGKEIDNSSTYCPHCGCQIERTGRPTPENVYSEATPDSEVVLSDWRKARPFASFLDKYGEKHLKWLFKIVAALLAVISIVKLFTTNEIPSAVDTLSYFYIVFLFMFFSDTIDCVSPVIASKSLWKYTKQMNYDFFALTISDSKKEGNKFVSAHLYSDTPKFTIIYLSDCLIHLLGTIPLVFVLTFVKTNLQIFANLPNDPDVIFKLSTYNSYRLLIAGVICLIAFFIMSVVRIKLMKKETGVWEAILTKQLREYREEKRKETEVTENTLDGKTKEPASEHEDTKI